MKINGYHKANRLITMFSMIFLLFIYLVFPVSAKGNESYVAEMNNTIWSWYFQIRSSIALPLLAVSFAYCGIRILGASLQNKGEQVMDAVRSQILLSFLALIVLMALPAIMSAAKGIFATSAWTPPETNAALPVIEPTEKYISETIAATTAATQP